MNLNAIQKTKHSNKNHCHSIENSTEDQVNLEVEHVNCNIIQSTEKQRKETTGISDIEITLEHKAPFGTISSRHSKRLHIVPFVQVALT